MLQDRKHEQCECLSSCVTAGIVQDFLDRGFKFTCNEGSENTGLYDGRKEL